MALPLITSPISKVPYDILREIFIHCLPRYRLRHPQPDVTIAPMLLCQICSSWRMVALTSATLWSHLSYCLSVRGESQNCIASDWIVPEKEYTFLTWWKKNQRSMAPFLRLDLNWKCTRRSKHPELALGAAGMVSFFEYISSVPHLEINMVYWRILDQRTKHGYPIVYPNPHSLVTFGHEEDETSFYDIQLALLPNPILSALRQLSVNHDFIPSNSAIPNCWSALTHISLEEVNISLAFWFPLIRAVPALQWANLSIYIAFTIEHPQPTKCTLPHLSTFFVTTYGTYDETTEVCPLSVIFTELYLPALQNLALNTDEGSWRDHRAIPELYLVLHSTPAITTLTLGCAFLFLEYNEYFTMTLPAIRDVEPIWRHATHLVHLRLELLDTEFQSQASAKDRRDTLIQNIFHRDNPWLDLDNPACPIQKIIIVNATQDDLPPDSFVKFTMSSIQKYAENAPNVKAYRQVALDSEKQTASEVWNESVQI